MPSQINLDGWNHPNLFVMAAPSVHRLSINVQSVYILVNSAVSSDLSSLL